MTNAKRLARCVRAVTWCGVAGLLGCGASERSESTTHTQVVDAALRRLQTTSPLRRHAPRLPRKHPVEVELAVDAGAAAPDAGQAAPVDVELAADAGAAAPDAGEVAPSVDVDAGMPPPPDSVGPSALPLYALEGDRTLPEAELWARLAASPVVCFGELHDRPEDHLAEGRALEELVRRAGDAPLAVGFEMIQRPYQAPLSAYMEGQLDEAGLLAGVEWATRWGYDFAFYRPLFEGAREAGLPALALNAPRELTRKIGRTGLESLDAAEAAQLPELDLQDAEHRAFIFGLFGVLPEHAAELGLESVYAAQTVWDETMADTAARWLLEAGPGAQLLVFAGSAHCHESAIPRRITRRTGLDVVSLAVSFEPELAALDFSASGYDVLVVLENAAGSD